MASPDVPRLEAIIAAQRDIAAGGLDAEGVMRLVVERSQDLTGATAGVVEIADGDEMVYRAASGTAAQHVGLRLRAAASLSGLCVRTGEVLTCVDSELDARVDREACRRVGARSMIVVPLQHAGRSVGVLKVMSPRPSAFDESDLAALQVMASVIASALERAAADEALRGSEERFRALAQTASDAIVTIDRRGAVTFWNRAAELIFGRTGEAMLGRTLTEIMPERFRSAHSSGLARLAGGGEPQILGRALDLFGLRANGDEFPLELSIAGWSSGGAKFFTAIARDITERKAVEARLLELARVDGVTGLLTRRAGEERLAAEHARAVRSGADLSFVLVDVDNFKRVNDQHGHAKGDDVLRALGSIVGNLLRTTDAAVRWGGEEVLLILAHTTDVGARVCAERVRQHVAAADCGGIHVTVSSGVAQLELHESSAAAIARADVRLYEAKAAGRDCVR